VREFMKELVEVTDDSLCRFLTWWYGEPDLSPVKVAGGGAVPTVLADWSALVSQWSRPLVTFNRPVDLEEIEVVDGMACFWDENQGCWQWAYEVGEDDPWVFEQQGPDDPWLPTDERLSDFLLHAMVDEAIFNTSECWTAGKVASTRVPEIVDGLTRLPFASWRWSSPGATYYAGEDHLVLVTPMTDRHDDGTYSCEITVASRVRGIFESLGLASDLNWLNAEAQAQKVAKNVPPPW